MSPTLWYTLHKHPEVILKRENLLVYSVYWKEQSSGEPDSVTPHQLKHNP